MMVDDVKCVTQRATLLKALNFWLDNLTEESDVRTLFADKEALFGQQLSSHYKTQILSYINAPSLAHWEAIQWIFITPTKTLWQMMKATHGHVLTTHPQFTPDNLPTSEALVAVLSGAIAQHNRDCRKHILNIETQLSLIEGELDDE